MALCSASIFLRLATVLGLAVATVAMASAPAAAQEVVVSVNGDPITSYDLEQREKLLRGLHKPAGRDAAIESLISDRLMAREASRYGINISDEEIGSQIAEDARKAKMTTQAFAAEASRTGASPEHVRNHFKSELAYNVLIKGLNRGVEASETQIRSELAREKGKSGVTDYTIRQVVFTLSPSDGPAQVEAALKQATALRTRFTSCDSGIAYAKTLPGVAIRAKLTRDSTQLSDEIKQVLDAMPVGHLSAPTRSGNGIELIALCGRGAPANDDQLRKQIGDRILSEHLESVAAQRYREMRATAVIERPRG